MAGRDRREIHRRGAALAWRRRQDRSACFGIAGPIENNICRATNLPWVVDGSALSQRLASRASSWSTTSRPPRWASPRLARTSWSPLGGGPPVDQRPDRGAGRRHGPRPGVPALVAAPRTATRSSRRKGGTSTSRRARRWSTAWSTFLTRKYGRVSCERVLSGQGAGRRVHVPVRGAGLPRADSAGDDRGAGPARAAARSGRRHLRARAGRQRSGLRDGAGDLLLRAGRVRRKPGADGAGDGRRVRGGRYRAAHPAVSAAGRVPRGVRPQGPPAHPGRAHPRLRRHPPPAGPAGRRHDCGRRADS